MCSVDGCDRATFSRGWCQKHYTRWLRHGDPTYTVLAMDLSQTQRLERFIDRSDPNGCWLWTGRLNDAGYGVTKIDGRESLVHRWMWEHARGAMPAGLVGDHLCRVRHCVNPDHIEPVTAAENTRRGESPGARSTRSDLCARGHDLNEHGYVRPDGRGRNCLACNRENIARRRARQPV